MSVSVFIRVLLNNFYFSSSFSFEIISVSITVSNLIKFSLLGLLHLLEIFILSFYIDIFALIDNKMDVHWIRPFTMLSCVNKQKHCSAIIVSMCYTSTCMSNVAAITI